MFSHRFRVHAAVFQAFLLGALAVAPVAVAAETDEGQAERFAALEKTLSGVALVGFSTDSNKQPDELRKDRYELVMTKHLEGETWLVQAKFHYRDKDWVLPLALPIRWAGDTPVISLDKFPVPGLGEFSARVVIDQNHYAGFWSGGGHSGHLFGKVERLEPAKAADAE